MIDHSTAWKLFFDPKKFILVQKRHPYTGNLNSEMSGDSKYVFLRCGDVSASAHADDTVQPEVALSMASNSCSQLNLYLAHIAR